MGRSHWFDLYRLGLVVMFALTVFACSGGGGCSSCAGCGIEPIPGGFPADQRIDNSAQVRLTSDGLDYIEDNIDPIVTTLLPDGLDFAVPRTTASFAGTLTICDDEDCVAHLEIRSLELTPVEPNRLRAHLEVYIDSRDDAGNRRGLPIDYWACNGNIDINSGAGSREIVGFNADIVFANETRDPRTGYTRLIVENADLDPAQDIETDDIRVRDCFLSGLLNLARGLIIDQLTGQLTGLLDSALGDNLCTTRGEFGCPTGTFAVPDEDPASVCRFGPAESDECVPILLGTDGRGDLGGTLIGGFSPGTHAYAQFLLASGGDGEAVNDGMSLFMYGGFMGTDRSFTETPAHNSCVPVTDPPPLPTIARAEAFRGNVIPGTSNSAHVGIGVSESYLDYAGWGLFDSGALCIGAGTRLSQMLSSGLVSALVMSLPALTMPDDNAALTIAVRPQLAPDFTIGAATMEDPLLQIALNQVEIDFYIWSTERYVRFMTFQTDLNIGINLSVEDGQLVPTIDRLSAGNSTVTNSDLLEERPEQLAAALEGLVGGLASQLASSLSPFDLPDIMGFVLDVPPGGILPVREGGESFLGIFANLSLAGPMMLTAEVDTRLEASDLELDRASMTPATWGQGEPNRVWLHFGAEGPQVVQYEYSYRVDGGPWSRWTTEPRVQIEDELLLFQARHEIEARARILGEPASVDPTPALVEVVVDILAPRVAVERHDDGIVVAAHDIVTPDEALEYRYQIDGEWTAWTTEPTLALPTTAAPVLVEVRDESGNVGRAESALIRGIANPAAGNGCGCRAAGQDEGTLPLGPLGLLGLLGVFGLVGLRRRRAARGAKGRLAARLLGLLGGALLLAAGCNCSEPIPCAGACMAAAPPSVTAGAICCEATDMCANYDVDALCDPGYTCPIENLVLDEACGVTCSACMVKPDLDPGILATHLDAVLDDSDTLHLSGYSPGRPSGQLYGDLLFGTYDGSDVTWEIVDGAPTSPITNNPDAWRGGVSAPGDDVGRWTSIVEDNGTYWISYYDQTNGALKLATGGPGAWTTHTIDDAGDSGRYSSLVMTSAGPVVGYLRMAESTDMPGIVMGSVMVATASTPNPGGASDWTITEVASAAMPCRQAFCQDGQCIEDGQCVTPTSDCAEACASGEVCFMGSCRVTVGSGFVEDLPPAYGLYVSLAATPSGLAVVFYDRTAGNIYGSSFDGSTWSSPFLIDGYAVGDPFIGDCGMGADLFVDDAGTWHVVYVDGAEETLRYAVVTGGAVTSTEVVDDGSTDGTNRFDDGRHIVGDDASIVVDGAGTVRVVYQDATAQHAVVAVRGTSGWAVSHFDTDGSTGYWLEQELSGTTSFVATHWRARNRSSLDSGVRVFALD